jgi:hypothetical protein
MSFKHLSRLLCACGVALLALSACNKSAAPAPGQQAQAFQSATPQNQADWGLALEASKTNDFVVAMLTLRKLQGQADLTPEQRAAVKDRMTEVNDQMAAAVQKGDPDAIKAMEEIRRRWRTQ